MAKHKQLSPFSVLGIVIAVVGLALSVYALTQSTEFRQRAAVGAVLYITGTPADVSKGQKITVSLDVESNTVPVQTATVILTYPHEKLKYQKMDFNKSPFDMTGEHIQSTGYIRLSRDASSPVNGKNHIVTLHFVATENVSLTEIKPVTGTAIISTENKNIYKDAVTHTAKQNDLQMGFFDGFFRFLGTLFSRNA